MKNCHQYLLKYLTMVINKYVTCTALSGLLQQTVAFLLRDRKLSISVLLQSAALNAIRCVLSEQTFRSMNALHIEYCVTLPTRVDNDDGDSVNPVWCFLENIRDPSNPSSGCYADTTWSPKDGRFWSAEACNGLPPLDTDNILIAVSCLTFLS